MNAITMNYSEFTKLAAAEINFLYDQIELLISDGDLDLMGDVLYIYTAKGDYVINQHSPTQQLWLSSPISNAGYFNYNNLTQEWLDKNNLSLRQRLSQDLNILIAFS
jgi:frataxin-like iron-binding protein CyaY